MAPNRIPEFPYQLAEYLEQSRRTWMTSTVYLGGTSGSGGGAGGPPGGFVGQLVQTRVAYDQSELAIATTGSLPSLLDNLNHIRYMITSGSFGGGSGTLTGSGVSGRVAVWSSGSALTSGSAFLYDIATGNFQANNFTSAANTYGISNSSVGGTIRGQAVNTDGGNALSSAEFLAKVASGGGDPKSVYEVTSGSQWSVGTDNSDSDNFKISRSNIPGTNTALTLFTSALDTLGIGTKTLKLTNSLEIDPTGASSGNVLGYDGTKWVATSGSGGGFASGIVGGGVAEQIAYFTSGSVIGGNADFTRDSVLGTIRTTKINSTAVDFTGFKSDSSQSLAGNVTLSAIGALARATQSGTLANLYSLYSASFYSGGGTTTTGESARLDAYVSGNSYVSTLDMLRIVSPTVSSGTVNKLRGIHIGSITSGSIENFSILVDSGKIKTDDSTDTTSGASGSIYTAGGIGIVKGLYVGGSVWLSGMAFTLDAAMEVDPTGAVSGNVLGYNGTKWVSQAVTSGSNSQADYAQTTYTVGSVALGTTSGSVWSDVDATNIKVSITPALPGKYVAIFRFGVFTSGTAVNEFFRITDGTDSSHAIEHNFVSIVCNYSLTYIFDWPASARTVKLQKRITTATGLTTNVINIGTLGDVVEAPDMQVFRIGS